MSATRAAISCAPPPETTPTESSGSTGSGYSRGDEGFKQAPRPFVAGRQLFRVGLDPDDEPAVGHLDTFDQPILGRADGAQRGRQVADGLVVKAVDLDTIGADRSREQASSFDFQPVHDRVTRRAIMVVRRGALDVDVLPQRAAQRDVQDLDAATD